MPGYQRVLLKLSGEVFGGGKVGVDPDVVQTIAGDDPRERCAAQDGSQRKTAGLREADEVRGSGHTQIVRRSTLNRATEISVVERHRVCAAVHATSRCCASARDRTRRRLLPSVFGQRPEALNRRRG